VETIGGTGVALKFTRMALTSGRHVVTSNKELVATHGPELMELAADHGVQYLFEASVGGGIPIIHPMRVCLAASEIRGVSGILNGTTNYILTRMEQAGIPFATALKEAQDHGFAESNPEADVEGTDACRKLAILSSIAYGGFVQWKHIHTEGISQVDTDLIAIAASACAQVKLVARSRRTSDGRIAASVSPVALSLKHPVTCASGVNNAISLDTDALGLVLFFGPGAGAMPTASAVASDILECLGCTTNDRRHLWPSLPAGAMLPFEEHPVRILARTKPGTSSDLQARIGERGISCRAVGTHSDVLLCGENDELTEGLLAEILSGMEAGSFRWIRYID
jgi:homoserine dehydrogenase